MFKTEKHCYAIGMSFGASSTKDGLGCDKETAVSAGIGCGTGQISANVFHAKTDKTVSHYGANKGRGNSETSNDSDGVLDPSCTELGLDMSCTMGASTLMMVCARTDVSNIQPIIPASGDQSFSSANFEDVGFNHDFGGGAKLAAGLGQFPKMAVADLGMVEIGQVFADDDADSSITAADRMDLSEDRKVVGVGLSFMF